MKNLRWILPLAAFTITSTASAEDEKYRPRYEAAPKVRRHHVALAEAARRPIMRGDPVDANAPKRTAVGELVRVVDGQVILRVRLSEAQRAILSKRGFKAARSKDEIQSGQIYEGHLYQRYIAAENVSLEHLVGREGEMVRLELLATEAGYRRIVSASVKR